MDERQIERMAKDLGARAASRIDVEKTAQAVIQRVKEQPTQVAWWRRMPVLQSVAAAAVVVLVAGVLLVGRTGGGGGIAADFHALPELQALSAEELEEVYDSLVFDAPVYESATHGLYDMNEEQLRELLDLMEG